MEAQDIIAIVCSILSLFATIGIGIIAYLQNKKYAEYSTRQNLKQEYQIYRDIVQKDFDYVCTNFFPHLLNERFCTVISESGSLSDKTKTREINSIIGIYSWLEIFKVYVLSTKTHSDYIGLGFDSFYEMTVSFDKLICFIDDLYKKPENKSLIEFWEEKLVNHNGEIVPKYKILFDNYIKYYRKYLYELTSLISKIGDYSITNKDINKEIADLKSQYKISLKKYRAYLKKIEKEQGNE